MYFPDHMWWQSEYFLRDDTDNLCHGVEIIKNLRADGILDGFGSSLDAEAKNLRILS